MKAEVYFIILHSLIDIHYSSQYSITPFFLSASLPLLRKEFDLRSDLGVLRDHGPLDVSLSLTVAGHAKTVPLLQNGPSFRHCAKTAISRGLARIPMSVTLRVL